MSYLESAPVILLAVATLLFQGKECQAKSLEEKNSKVPLVLEEDLEVRCLNLLKQGLVSEQFWPAMHAAEALSLADHGLIVKAHLLQRLPGVTDDRQLCGVARELVRAGDRSHVSAMLSVLAKEETYGHVHACESLYKVNEIGDGKLLRDAFRPDRHDTKTLMSAAALARWGNPTALLWLREELESENHTQARLSAWALSVVGDKSDIPAIKKRRDQLQTAAERHFFDNALAVLGDKSGASDVLKNLKSSEQEIKVYAALTAGEAGLQQAKELLVSLLDDRDLDTSIRAAQSLLMMANPQNDCPKEIITSNVYPATANNPRYSEGSVLGLRNGNLLFATTEFQKTTSDFAKAQIVAKTSSDQGKTWGESRVIQENTGDQNVMSVTLRYLAPETESKRPLGMFYVQKNSHQDLQVLLRISEDEGETFGEAIRVSTTPGYHVFNNDRATRLESGRWVVPVASTSDVGKVNHFVCSCFLSDDGGKTWRASRGSVDYEKRGAMEPEVLELNDGRVVMLFRTQSGHIGSSYSEDGGDTWSKPEPYQVVSPESPATLRRIPSTGDLLLIWNHNYEPGKGHNGRRNPLTAAVSHDEGKTWQFIKDLENDPQQAFSYTSLLFDRGRAVLSYYVHDAKSKQFSTRFRSLPIGWFYSSTSVDKESVDEQEEPQPEVVLELPPQPGNPRNSEGDFIQLKDGRIMFIYTHFLDGAGDHSKATLQARFSADQGKTWTVEDTPILDNEGGINVMSVSLLRLTGGEIALFYLRKNSLGDCRPCVRISTDEGKTWGAATECITDLVGYYVLNNNRAIQLKTGRIVLPICQHSKAGDTKLDMKGEIMCYLSDDQGKTWRRSKTAMKAYNEKGGQITTQEPGVVELKDGRVLMLIRSDAGSQLMSYSEDGGETWSEMKPSSISSPVSPASIERIPGTGDLLLVWNDVSQSTPQMKRLRTPLTTAISRDEGKTWEHVQNVFTKPTGWYCYMALDFVGDSVLIGHCAGDRSKNNGLAETHITRIPLSWIYQKETAGNEE